MGKYADLSLNKNMCAEFGSLDDLFFKSFFDKCFVLSSNTIAVNTAKATRDVGLNDKSLSDQEYYLRIFR